MTHVSEPFFTQYQSLSIELEGLGFVYITIKIPHLSRKISSPIRSESRESFHTYLRYEDVWVGAEALCDDSDGQVFLPGEEGVTDQQLVVGSGFIFKAIP